MNGGSVWQRFNLFGSNFMQLFYACHFSSPSLTRMQATGLEPQQVPTSASLQIKEFVPGQKWFGDGTTSVAGRTTSASSSSDSWRAPGSAVSASGNGGSGGGLVRRGSLTMGRKVDGSSVAMGSLSSSDWSLDMVSVEPQSLKNDLTLSAPTVWSPIDGKLSEISNRYQTSGSSSFHSGASESGIQSGMFFVFFVSLYMNKFA